MVKLYRLTYNSINQHDVRRRLNKFGFIAYPLSLELLYLVEPELKNYDINEIKKRVKNWPPQIVSEIRGVKSIKTGEEIIGHLVLIYLLPDQMIDLPTGFVIDKIVEAGNLAEAKGAKIIGLGGLTSVIGNQGILVSKRLRVAVTTGNSYTAAMTIEAAIKASEKMGKDISKSVVAVIGATGSIGSVCAYHFSSISKEIVIVARNLRRLNKLAEELKNIKVANLIIERDINEAISNADIVITATSYPGALINVDKLKLGAVVVDVATPRNVEISGISSRPDVLVVDGGLIKPPGDMKIDINIGLPDGSAYACLSETMILTFEKMFENYTLGSGLDMKKVRHIRELGEKHGFKLDKLKSFGKSITKQDIEKAKRYINTKS